MPVGGEDHPLIFAAPQEWNKPLIFAALRACNSAVRRCLGRLRGARVRLPSMGLKRFTALEHEIPPSGGVWDACAARGKVGPVMGLRPLLGPPCIPPRSTP